MRRVHGAASAPPPMSTSGPIGAAHPICGRRYAASLAVARPCAAAPGSPPSHVRAPTAAPSTVPPSPVPYCRTGQSAPSAESPPPATTALRVGLVCGLNWPCQYLTILTVFSISLKLNFGVPKEIDYFNSEIRLFWLQSKHNFTLPTLAMSKLTKI
jgi:hypothetical protein